MGDTETGRVESGRFDEAECQGSKAAINAQHPGIFGAVDWADRPVDRTAGLEETAAAGVDQPDHPTPTQDIDG